MRLIIISEQEDERMEVATGDQRQIHRVSVQSRRSPADVNFQHRALDIYIYMHVTRNRSTRNSRDSIRFTICNSNESAIPSKKLDDHVNDLRRSKGIEKLREYQEYYWIYPFLSGSKISTWKIEGHEKFRRESKVKSFWIEWKSLFLWIRSIIVAIPRSKASGRRVNKVERLPVERHDS